MAYDTGGNSGHTNYFSPDLIEENPLKERRKYFFKHKHISANKELEDTYKNTEEANTNHPSFIRSNVMIMIAKRHLERDFGGFEEKTINPCTVDINPNFLDG